jgi:WD40 repeat protein
MIKTEMSWLPWLEYKRLQENEMQGNLFPELPLAPEKKGFHLKLSHHFRLLRRGRIQSLEVHPHREQCAFGDTLNGVTLYQSKTQETSYIPGYPYPIFDVTFFQEKLLGVSYQGHFALYPLNNPVGTWETVFQTRHGIPLHCLSYHPQKHHLVAGDAQGHLYFVLGGDWNSVQERPEKHLKNINFSLIDETGNYAVFGSYDGMISLWNLKDLKQEEVFYHTHSIQDGYLYKNSLFLISENSYSFYELPSFQLKWEYSEPLFKFALTDISPDGRYALIALPKTLLVFQRDTGEKLASYSSRNHLYVARFLANHQIVALSGFREMILLNLEEEATNNKGLS